MILKGTKRFSNLIVKRGTTPIPRKGTGRKKTSGRSFYRIPYRKGFFYNEIREAGLQWDERLSSSFYRVKKSQWEERSFYWKGFRIRGTILSPEKSFPFSGSRILSGSIRKGYGNPFLPVPLYPEKLRTPIPRIFYRILPLYPYTPYLLPDTYPYTPEGRSFSYPL